MLLEEKLPREAEADVNEILFKQLLLIKKLPPTFWHHYRRYVV